MAVNNKNPFYTGDTDDDYPFGARNSHSRSGGFNDDPFKDDEGPVDYVQIQQNSMNSQLESTQRCLASIYDSEAMGIATAEELVQQGEQLDNIEHKLDTVNQDVKTTQRHLNNIKSVFGGIKNWWSGKKEGQAPEKPKARQSQLKDSLEQGAASTDQREHPAFRVRANDTSGFYEDSAASKSSCSARGEHWQRYEAQLDQNLDAMSTGLARLKGLGTGLGNEIDAQNTQIERITGKAERADITIKDQNRQMKHILGK